MSIRRRMCGRALAAGLLLGACRVTAPSGGPHVCWPEAGGGEPVRVVSLPAAELAAAGAGLRVYVEAEVPVPPVSGRVEVEDGAVAFRPRHPWQAGLAYRAELARPDGPPLVSRHAFPAPELAARARVAAVHPDVAEVPANLLRFYVEFSEPMSLGEAREHVRLVDDTGSEVREAFLPLEPELWDPERRRLTLILDPGRTKRGLRPNRELGAPLEEGRGYALVVDADFTDARGAPLAEGHRHAFRAVAPDRASPSLGAWTVVAPPAGTRQPFTLRFPEPLDHELLLRMVDVLDPAGRPVPGELELAPGDRAWSLVPAAPWRAGVHELVVDPRLEDLAGNNLARPFEVALDRAGDEVEAHELLRMTCDLRPAPAPGR